MRFEHRTSLEQWTSDDNGPNQRSILLLLFVSCAEECSCALHMLQKHSVSNLCPQTFSVVTECHYVAQAAFEL
jgi:hypothetical protein